MSKDFMQDITDAYKLLNDITVEYEVLLTELRSKTEPERPVIISSADQWQSYTDAVEASKKYVEETNSTLLTHRSNIDGTKSLLLSLIPAKAVWFKLSGLTVWVAKVSSNLKDDEGKSLLIATKESDLSPLTTL